MAATPTVVAGRYRLLRQLGSGGMGKVWLAHDDMLGRQVAVKQVVLPPGLSADEAADARSRTLREARTAAKLNHPSVVKIYDVVLAGEQPWIVMEYLPARSLHEIIAEDGPLDPVRVAGIGLALLGALTAAHEAGVLHRDVKPGNVLLAADGRVVLSDFGLATFDGGESALTLTGIVLGSIRFVAPERARDGVSSPATDLWALGATLYAAVEGRPPYARNTATETLVALATALPDPPHRAGPLRPVLRGLLRRNPKHRIGPEEARRLLLAAAGGEAPPRRRLLALSASGAVALVAAVTAVVALSGGGTRPHPAPTPSAVPVVAGPFLGGPVCPTAHPGELRPASRRPDWPALVDGWVWYQDPSGFRLAVPAGWQASTGTEGTCFRQPGDERWLGVTSWTPGGDPLAHLAGRQRDLAGASGYQLVSTSAVPYYRAAADWEFRFQNPAGQGMHAVVRDFVVAPGRGYTIAWCTTEFDWTLNLDNFRLVVASFAVPT